MAEPRVAMCGRITKRDGAVIQRDVHVDPVTLAQLLKDVK